MSSAMYYIAVVAPDPINEQVVVWKKYMRDRFGCIVALKSPAHITLISPFWMNQELQPQLETFLEKFCSERKSFLIQLKNFGSFKPRVIFVQVEHSEMLLHLKTTLETDLSTVRTFPIKTDSRPFHPHITIANRDLNKKDFYPAWEHFKNKAYEYSFLVSGLSILKHSGSVWDLAFSPTFRVDN